MVMTLDDLKNLPPITEDEKRIIEAAVPTPSEDCPAMTTEELKQFRPWHSKGKKTITMNLDTRALVYFKGLSEEIGVPYQTLMNMYLVQCAEEKKRPTFA